MSEQQTERLSFEYVRIQERRHFFRKDRTLEMFAGAMGFLSNSTERNGSMEQLLCFTAGKTVLCRTSSLHHNEARVIATNGAECVYIQDPTLDDPTITHSRAWKPSGPNDLINGLQVNYRPLKAGSKRNKSQREKTATNRLNIARTQDFPDNLRIIPFGKNVVVDLIIDLWSDGLLLPKQQARNYIVFSVKNLNAGGSMFISPPGRLLQMLEQTTPKGAITLRQKLEKMGAKITYTISKGVYPSHIRIDKQG